MRLPYIEPAEELVGTALRKARKEAEKISYRNRFKLEKSREARRIEVFAKNVSGRLSKAEDAVPTIEDMNPFYRELVECIVSVPELKKSVSQMRKVRKIVGKLKAEHLRAVKGKKRGERVGKEESRKFFGRAASLLKSLGKSIECYNDAGKKLRELPRIDFSVPTVILAGYPNTGKTTVLFRLTGSKPEIASYPFTTKGIMVGKMVQKHREVQVIDTPGLLDRPIEKRNPVERKAMAALKHVADLVVFVIDPTQRCGFPLEEQLALLKEVRKMGKKVVVLVNKADIASKEEMKAVLEKAGKGAFAEGEGIESGLGGKIFEKLTSQ